MPSPASLQLQPTSFIGRADELEIIRQRLTDHEAHLLTLTGPPGVGKSRLALEAATLVAGAFPDGVSVVDLTRVRDPEGLLPAIGQSLHLAETNGRALLERLQEHLLDRRLLLVLDILESVLPAAPDLAELLATCPGLTMLVTSRIPLHLRWEQTLRISPLAVPDLAFLSPLVELERVPAVALFLERARAINSDFALNDDNAGAVAELCIHLDGLPLALELAAARMLLLSPRMIVERLEQRLSLLHWEAQDLPERQQSLSAAIGWSYDLLSQDDQALFRQLGVFVSGFDLDAAEKLGAKLTSPALDVLEGLGSLVDKSLVQVEGQGEPQVRYFSLESVREYAWNQLEEHGELDTASRTHAQYFVALADRAETQLQKRDQLRWFSRLEQEHDNLGAALRWLLDHDEQDSALRLAAALGYFWFARGAGPEGWLWLEETLDRATDADPAIRAKALLWAGMILIHEGELDRPRAMLEEALALARQTGHDSYVAQALTYLGVRATLAGDWAESSRFLEEALRRSRELRDRVQIGSALGSLGCASFMQGEFEQAAAFYEEALAQFEASGNARTSGAMRVYLALAVRQLGDLNRAASLLQEAVEASVFLHDRWQLRIGVDATLVHFGDKAIPEVRAQLLGGADALRRLTGFRKSFWEHMSGEGVSMLREQTVAPGENRQERTSHTSDREKSRAAYQQGQSLSFEEIGSLAVSVLGDFHRALDRVQEVEESTAQSILSDREMEVLKLVAEGLSSKVIGKQLFISVSTVNYHLTSVFNKLGVDTRAQAVATAARRGIL